MVPPELGDDTADLVARAMEAYFERLRLGEHPQLEEFVEQYPEISHVLRTVIPGLQAAEPSPDVSFDSKVAHDKPKRLGDFRILRQIGRGGMGVVFEAEQISMNRRVALKVLPLAGLADELKIRRFQNEVRAVAALDHPNIVSVYMVGEERGVHYYAMQLIRGRSLSEVISSLRHARDEGEELDSLSIGRFTRRDGLDDGVQPEPTVTNALAASDARLDVGAEGRKTVAKADSSTISHSSRRQYFRSVAELGIQAATALQHAHDEGIVHRDIKPANLLLDSASKLYVTDFGLARIESDAGVTMTGDLVGTLRYMAPEQALAKRVVVDHRADIYSLAATLYELLTLRPAYLAEDRQELLKQIAFEEPVQLRRIDRSIPAELETIVHKAMSKDMDRRYASAQELADDLRSHLENRPIHAKPPTTSEIISKWTHRNPTLTWSAIITLLLVTLTLVASTLVIAKKERNAQHLAETRRQELYAAQVNLAHQAWVDGDLERAQNLLASLRPEPNQSDLRGFEWRYLWQLCQDESRQPLGVSTSSNFGSLSFSADGSKLAVAEGKMVRVWDFADLRELPPVAPHTKGVATLVFSPTNPNLLATVDGGGGGGWPRDADMTIKLWDLTTDGPPSIIPINTSVAGLAFSADGEKLASASWNGGVQLWDVETRSPYWSEPGQHRDTKGPDGGKARPALCVAFSPDGELVASGGGDTRVRLWNAATGKEEEPPLEGHTAYVVAVEFSPDGRLLATVGFDSRVFIWDVATHSARSELLGHRGVVKSVVFSPDGKALVSGGADHTIRTWSVATSRQINMLRGHTGEVKALAFSPRGQSLVSASGQTVKLWDALSNDSHEVLTGHSGWVSSVALSPDGKTLVTADFHTLALKLWDVPSRSLLAELRGRPAVPEFPHIAISPAGKFLASGGDGRVRLWDLSMRESKRIFPCGFEIGAIGFSADGTVLGAAGAGLKFWNVASGREFELLKGDTSTAKRLAFSAGGGLLATADKDGRVVVWDASDGKEVTSFRDEADISCLAFSRDERLIAVGKNDGSITLFDLTKPENPQQLQGHTAGVTQVAFTPDSKTLASTGWDNSVRLWTVATGQTALTLQHLGPATGVAFSDDGRLMATSGADATARLWFAASLSEADASLGTGASDRD